MTIRIPNIIIGYTSAYCFSANREIEAEILTTGIIEVFAQKANTIIETYGRRI